MGNQPAAVTQSRAQRLRPVTGRRGSSQAWAWTGAARFNLISDKKQPASGTPPRPTSTPHNIISSSTRGGGVDLPQLSGEKCVSIFPLSVAETTKQSLLYFPHYCSLVWIPPLLSAFLQYTHSRGSPASVSRYYPETAAQQGCTGPLPKDPTRFPQHWAGQAISWGTAGGPSNTFGTWIQYLCI